MDSVATMRGPFPRVLAFLATLFFPVLLMAADEPEPFHVTLKNGSVVRGELISQDAHSVKIRARMGDITIPKKEIREDSLERVTRKEEKSKEELQNRTADLEKKVMTLEAENARLKAGSPGAAPKPGAAEANPSKNLPAGGTLSSPVAPDSHWLSASGKRHNVKCRYYGSGNGKPCQPEEGTPCKICGG